MSALSLYMISHKFTPSLTACKGKYLKQETKNSIDFRNPEDFRSTKYNYITCHIVMTLVGVTFISRYTKPGRREKYSGKSLPVLVKNYKVTRPESVIIYVRQYFGIFTFLNSCNSMQNAL